MENTDDMEDMSRKLHFYSDWSIGEKKDVRKYGSRRRKKEKIR
jgi:hypothetical protein